MRILGLDIGSTSVKILELDAAFGRFEVHEYHERKIPPGVNPIEITEQMIASLPKKAEKVCLSLRSNRTTFRTLHLPTRDKKAIASSVGFELEDDLPFASDQAVYDYSVISQTGQNTEVHATATLKKYVATQIADLASIGIEPDLITSEAWAFRTLLNRLLSPETQKSPVLLFHMGHDHTTLYVHHQNSPVVVQDIPVGGRDLTLAISQKYQIPLDQAESAKLDHGFVLPYSQRNQATSDQVIFSDCLLPSLQEILQAVRQINLACKNICHAPISQVYLAGGSSLLPGLGRLIEEEIKVPVLQLQALSGLAKSGITYSEQTDAHFALSAASALCMISAERNTTINFRRGDLAKKGQSREINLQNFKKPIQALSAIVLTLIVSLSVQSYIYKSKLAETDKALEKEASRFFSDVGSSPSSSALKGYLANTPKLLKVIKAELIKSRETAKLMSPNPQSPFQFLKTLSSQVGKDIPVDMMEYQVGAGPTTPYQATSPQSAQLTFLVSNPQIAEKLTTVIEKRLSDVQKSKLEEVTPADGSGKKWKVTFTGKPKEDSYGR